MKQSVFSSLIAGLALCLASTASAQMIVAAYTADGSQPVSSDSDASSTASDISVGGGFPLAYETRGFNADQRGNPTPSFFFKLNDDLTPGLLDDDYFAFSLTADSSDLTLGDFSFDYNTGGLTAYLFSDQAGFANVSDAIGSVSTASTGGSGSAVWDTYSISLTSLNDVTVGSTVNFRLYLEGTGNETQMDNITVSTAAVPEPSAYALLVGMLAFGWIMIRRHA
jgi:hypothetical protein